jgi:hypothetical protein
MIQPARLRTASVLAEASWEFPRRLHALVERAAALAKAWGGQLQNVLVALLTPAAVLALVLGLWRFTADLGWTDAFLIHSGFFSHWQVWIALAVALEILGREPRVNS